MNTHIIHHTSYITHHTSHITHHHTSHIAGIMKFCNGKVGIYKLNKTLRDGIRCGGELRDEIYLQLCRHTNKAPSRYVCMYVCVCVCVCVYVIDLGIY